MRQSQAPPGTRHLPENMPVHSKVTTASSATSTSALRGERPSKRRHIREIMAGGRALQSKKIGGDESMRLVHGDM